MSAAKLDRRSFLRALLAAGLAMAAPAAAEQLTLREEWRIGLLREAWKRAADAEKPLLVIVIPDSAPEQELRGRAWGELFDRGADEAIAVLVAAELVTATQADLGRLLPDYAPQARCPVLLRVDAAADPAAWEAFWAELPGPWRASPDPADHDSQIRALELVIFQSHRPTRRELRIVRRSGAIEARRSAPVPGARWRRSGGCSSIVEPDPLFADYESLATRLCGMAHTPARSELFLEFLVRELW